MIFNKIRIILIGLASIFNYDSAPTDEVKVIEYQTEYVYAEKYSEGEELIIQEGEHGYSHLVNGKEVEHKEPVNEIIQVGTHKNTEYKGTLTGYGPDCVGCNKQAIVACKTADRKLWSLTADGLIYTDHDYGEVRIVAADKTLFPCGTIIEINNSKYKGLLAVVLDTGHTMRKSWRKNQTAWLDLAFETDKGTNAITNKKTKFHVKRWGW